MSNLATITDYKDEDDSRIIIERITVDPYDNGYVLHVFSDDGDLKEVYQDKKDLITRIKNIL